MVYDHHQQNFPFLLPFLSLLYIWAFIDIWIQLNQICNCKYSANNQILFLRGMLSKQTKSLILPQIHSQHHLFQKNKDFFRKAVPVFIHLPLSKIVLVFCRWKRSGLIPKVDCELFQPPVSTVNNRFGGNLSLL